MKQFIAVVLCILVGLGAFFFLEYSLDKSVKDTNTWVTNTETEYSVKLPKTMKRNDAKFTASSGTQGVAFYTNSIVSVGISKIPYDVNPAAELADIAELFKYMSFNGTKLVPKDLKNGGCYVVYNESEDKKKMYYVEGYIKGKDALYGVTVKCRLSDKDKYEKYMVEILESFKPQ